jgi:hypothetical protein
MIAITTSSSMSVKAPGRLGPPFPEPRPGTPPPLDLRAEAKQDVSILSGLS